MDPTTQARREKVLKDLSDFANHDTTKFVFIKNTKFEQCEDERKWERILPVVQEFQQELGHVHGKQRMILLRLQGTESSQIPIPNEQAFLPITIHEGHPTIGGQLAEVGVVIRACGPIIEPSLILLGVEV